MSPRTIGGVTGYYENLLTPRALFSTAALRQSRSGFPAHNFDTGAPRAPGHREPRFTAESATFSADSPLPWQPSPWFRPSPDSRSPATRMSAMG